jgi:hypothetical protein
MQTENISAEIDKTIKDFVQLLSVMDDKTYNVVPFKDSWTTGQLAQHVLLSVSAFTQLIYGPVKETERAPDLGIENLRKVFLNLDTKFKSPDFILPPAIDYIKEQQVNTLDEKRELLLRASETLDLTQTCTTFEMPRSGFITRLEALHFVVYHTQRHTHQLRNIYHSLTKN